MFSNVLMNVQKKKCRSLSGTLSIDNLQDKAGCQNIKLGLQSYKYKAWVTNINLGLSNHKVKASKFFSTDIHKIQKSKRIKSH